MSGRTDRAGTAPVLMDGATATELRRAGIPVEDPWWATNALLTDRKRGVLREVHERYLDAGAEVITANTFRCNRRALERMGLRDAGQGWMVHAAVGVAVAARNAAGTGRARIAGSVAPVEDCYRPDLAPPDDTLREEHAWLATELVRAGVDLIVVETANSVREARIATEQSLQVGAEVWVGLAGLPGALLRSGEPVADAARAVRAAGATAVLVNCTTPEVTTECLAALRADADGGGPLGASSAVEDRSGIADGVDAGRVLPATVDPDGFACYVEHWHRKFGLAVVGGCCGTTPAYLAAVRSQCGEHVAQRVDHEVLALPGQ